MSKTKDNRAAREKAKKVKNAAKKDKREVPDTTNPQSDSGVSDVPDTKNNIEPLTIIIVDEILNMKCHKCASELYMIPNSLLPKLDYKQLFLCFHCHNISIPIDPETREIWTAYCALRGYPVMFVNDLRRNNETSRREAK